MKNDKTVKCLATTDGKMIRKQVLQKIGLSEEDAVHLKKGMQLNIPKSIADVLRKEKYIIEVIETKEETDGSTDTISKG